MVVTTRRRARSLSSASGPAEDAECVVLVPGPAVSAAPKSNLNKSEDSKKDHQDNEDKQVENTMHKSEVNQSKNDKSALNQGEPEIEKDKIDDEDGSGSDNSDKEEEESARSSQRMKEFSSLSITSRAKISDSDTKYQKHSNALTHLIPGYTAPMKLNTSSLDKYRPAGGIRELQKRAERTDASTKDFVVEATTKHVKAMKKTPNGFLPNTYSSSYSSFKQGVKRTSNSISSKSSSGLIPTPMSEELKTDLAVIRNRSYLDPKRFYKSADKHSKVVQMGTVIEGPTEYFSSRLTKKQRRTNFTDEIMADPASADYTKNKFKQMSQEKTIQAQKRKLKTNRVKKFF